MISRSKATKLTVAALAGLFGIAWWTNDRLWRDSVEQEHVGEETGIARETQMVYQDKRNNCGATALKMILNYYGRNYSLRDIESKLRPSRKGASFMQLKEAAEKCGIMATAMKLTVKALNNIHYPVIMLVDRSHYVVADGISVDSCVAVRDPAKGKMRIPLATLSKSWTGETLLLRPTDHNGNHTSDIGK